MQSLGRVDTMWALPEMLLCKILFKNCTEMLKMCKLCYEIICHFGKFWLILRISAGMVRLPYLSD